MAHDLARRPLALSTQPHEDEKLRRRIRDLLEDFVLQDAARSIREDDSRTFREQLLLASTPAPPFQEAERGRVMARLLKESGAGEPWIDAEGNVLAWMGPPGPAPLVVSAHLDTVFPASQEISFRQEGDRWIGPGICDDARGLAVLLALVRALAGLPGRPGYPVLVAASVGEEGVGDLRGVRHLFGPQGAAPDARGFISLDGAGVGRVIASGVGSRRFRATISGPGGHSWVDWGRVNPIQVLARAVAAFDHIPLPEGCTVNVGRVEGGTSVNAIPTGVWVEYETRSEREDELRRIEGALTRALEEAVAGADGAGRDAAGAASLDIQRIGHRPAGITEPGSPLVRAAVAATRVVTGTAELAASSTDANLPMSLGIPAITLGAGGEAGDAHTPAEWYRNVKGPEGVLRALLTLLALDAAAE